jgi:hypothetical protein
MITFEAREVMFRGKPRIEGSYIIDLDVLNENGTYMGVVETTVGERITRMFPAAVRIALRVDRHAMELQVLVNPKDTEAFLEVDCILKSLGLPV